MNEQKVVRSLKLELGETKISLLYSNFWTAEVVCLWQQLVIVALRFALGDIVQPWCQPLLRTNLTYSTQNIHFSFTGTQTIIFMCQFAHCLKEGSCPPICAELLQQHSVLCVWKLNSDMRCWSQHPSDTNLDTVFKIWSCDKQFSLQVQPVGNWLPWQQRMSGCN